MKIVHRAHATLSVASDTFTNPRKRGRGGRPVSVDDPETRALALHIGRHGLRYPLRIAEDGTILGGQRRHLAIGLMIRWQETLADDIEPSEAATFLNRALELASQVPCVVREGDDPADMTADALGDNLQRKEMSTYDVAETILELLEPPPGREPKTQAWISRAIGRSPSYVSRMVATWKNAIPPLHDAWASEALAYETVRAIAEMSAEDQAAALASPEPKARGTHGRPGIEAVKDVLVRLRDHGVSQEAFDAAALSTKAELDPVQVATEILGWVAGERPRTRFVVALLGIA